MQQPGDQRPRGFHKKGVRVTGILGTKPSIHNSTLLVSTGVPSLDALIGGGIAVGSCILIDEDRYNTYTSLLLKYYIAEGITNKHKIFLASANQPPSQILQDLPQPITHEPAASSNNPPSDADELSIAWRYKNQPSTQQTPATFGNYYDITKVMHKDVVSAADVKMFDATYAADVEESSDDLSHPYQRLLQQIQQTIEKEQLSTGDKLPSNILRVGIASLGSPYWSADTKALLRFLFALRALLRKSYATCFITLPGHLFADSEGIVSFSDCAIQLISFADNPHKYAKNPAFKEFHGLVKIRKLPWINSLICHLPDTLDWVFKLRRKRLTIEKMHLPPDLSETVSRSQEDPAKSFLSGQRNASMKIDF
ncbi:elongator complex protein 4-like [Watersipora subatra]|uniref:elongator complex protein 4-like n=1 Tax=Watersipora subatra TaxID=2589382 RepID=UPI00355B352F